METGRALLRARTVDPRLTHELGGFTCGGSTEYEREVDEIVQAFHEGRAGFVFMRIAEDAATGELAGLCTVQERPLEDYYAWCVAVIAVAESHRGRRTDDGGSIGDFVLSDALDYIRELIDPAPMLWAVIDPQNHRSHALFERHGFDQVILGNRTGARYDIRIRFSEADE